MKDIKKKHTGRRLAFSFDIARRYAEQSLRPFALSRFRPFAPSRLRAFVLSCLSCFSCFSQNYRADLEKACTLFTRENYEIEVEHLFYPSYTAVAPVDKGNVWIYKAGENYRMQQYDTEVIVNSDYIVMIYEDDRVICIEEKQGPGKLHPGEKEGVEALIKGMTQAAAQYGQQRQTAGEPEISVKYTETAGGAKSYRFDCDRGAYTRMDISICGKTGLLEKITCYYREPFEVEEGKFDRVKVDFIFRKQAGITRVDPGKFSVDPILSVNARGEVMLKEKYRGYEVINHIRR
jgi:hypothetical protein